MINDLIIPITGIISFWVAYFIINPLFITRTENNTDLSLSNNDKYSLEQRYRDEIQELEELKSLGIINEEEYETRTKLLLLDANNERA